MTHYCVGVFLVRIVILLHNDTVENLETEE